MTDKERRKLSRQRIVINFKAVPVAQGRPRFSTQSGFVRAIDPAKSRSYKAKLSQFAFLEMGKNGWDRFPKCIPLQVCIEVFLPISQSWNKEKKQLAMRELILPTSRPDIDNYAKCIIDALLHIAYEDDSSIVELKVKKNYVSEFVPEPVAHIYITEIGF